MVWREDRADVTVRRTAPGNFAVACFQMRFSRFLFATTAFMLPVTALAMLLCSAEGFAFAGLSPRTTMEAARKRYPRSSITGRHVYVSEVDSHDHIYGIDLPRSGDPRVRISFERRGRQRHDYPRCQQVIALITKQYGEPAVVQKFDEERSRNRRLIWRRGEDNLSLLCFRMGDQPFFAAELTITSGRQ
jgi:hypothetical protein